MVSGLGDTDENLPRKPLLWRNLGKAGCPLPAVISPDNLSTQPPCSSSNGSPTNCGPMAPVLLHILGSGAHVGPISEVGVLSLFSPCARSPEQIAHPDKAGCPTGKPAAGVPSLRRRLWEKEPHLFSSLLSQLREGGAGLLFNFQAALRSPNI